MCFATAALIAGGIGAATTAVGTIESGAATSNAANYNAQVAKNNATVATQNAAYAESAGNAQAEATSLKGAQKLGAVKAGQAASGIDVNTGSAVTVQKSEREENQLDTETVLNNAELQAYGYRANAVNYQAQSGLESEEAEQAPIGADISAAGGLLSSASSLGLKWTGIGNTNSSTASGGGGYTGYSPTG